MFIQNLLISQPRHFCQGIDKVMLIRSVLFNFQGAFLNSVFLISQTTLLLYHIFSSLSSGFSKFFEKVLKTFTEGHYPCGLEAPPRFELGVRVLQTHALPLGYERRSIWSGLRGSNSLPPPWQGGALPDELNPHKWCLRSESNQRHGDFQSPALPTELQRQQWRPGWGSNPRPPAVTGLAF